MSRDDVARLIRRTRALVVDDKGEARRLMRGQLSELGVAEVQEAGSAGAALRRIAASEFGLIVCDQTLSCDGADATTGQQLLEHLRHRALVPPRTIIVMCTAESGRDLVASAAECQPDDYLLKPFTFDLLEARLRRLFERQIVFEAVHRAMAEGDPLSVVAECDVVRMAHARWRIDALRIAGQALLDAGRHDEAGRVYGDALAARDDLAWARVGLARAHLAAGRLDDATTFSNAALQALPTCAAAFDVLLEAADARRDDAGALAVARRAAKAIPSVRRRRQLARIAFRAGDVATARTEFDRVVRATRGTVGAQLADATLLAQIHVDADDPARALAVLAGGRAADLADAGTTVALARHAVLAQAHAGCGNDDEAEAALKDARAALDSIKAAARNPGDPGVDVDSARLFLAKAHFATGDTGAGLQLLADTIAADHENADLLLRARRMLADTGHDDLVEGVISDAIRRMTDTVDEARALMRQARFDDSIARLESVLQGVPDNTAVLLSAAQLHLLWIRQKGAHPPYVERVRRYLARLDVLLPGAEPVRRMHRFFTESFAEPATEPEAEPAAEPTRQATTS